MTTIQYVLATIIVCIIYLVFVLANKKYRMLLPCTIHTLTWLLVSMLIYMTMVGKVGEYDPFDVTRSYDYVAPFIFGLVISSIIGFTLSHFIHPYKSKSIKQIDDDYLDNILKRYHWILYVCLALGILQTSYLLMAVGYDNLGDYRIAAVTLERTGIGAFSQQFSGHATILGTFYFALDGYKMGRKKFVLKRFLLDGFLLASTNLAIAGRGWIITILVPFLITYLWQIKIMDKNVFNKDLIKIVIIFIALLASFSIFGMIRNEDGVVDKSRFFDKFLYYTDGARITNYAFECMPDGSFDYEYGRSEFLYKWIGSPMIEQLEDIKSVDIGLSVTVDSSMPYLYFDYGWRGGIIMWGIFCFIIELLATIFRNRQTVFGIFIFMELSKVLFQAPIGNIFGMEIPVIEWLIILFVFRNVLFKKTKRNAYIHNDNTARTTNI